MDKRFLLALALTAVVIIATPWAFGTRGITRAPDARVDSARSSTPTVLVGNDSLATAVVEVDTPSVATNPSPASGEDTTRRVIAADTAVVSTPLAEYRLTNVGARILSVKLNSFRALNGTSQLVTLHSSNNQLLSYRLFLPADTVDLSSVRFDIQRTAASNGQGETVTFRSQVRGVALTIQYAFVPDSYLVRVSGGVQVPAQGTAYLAIGMPVNLQSAEADSLDDQQHLAYALKPQRESAKGIPFSKLDPGEQRLEQGPITWVAAKNKYFIVGLLTPEQATPFAEVLVTGGPRTGRRATHASATVVRPLQNGTFSFEVYTGPQEWRRLLALGRDFENSNPYGGFLQGVVQPFATIVMRILLWMRATLSLSYGWVLVIFGVTIRLLLWPLNQKAMRTSMKMSRLQPELSEIQKRYKSDPQRLQAEMMRIYKDHGMSPFSSLSGCLPMLLPMPILFALFFVFQNTIEFRGVPFLWLSDISLKDPTYIVPIVMGLSMFVLSLIGMRNSPPNPQAKMMAYVLPVMMTVFFLNLASGLNLYYAIQNITAIPQQWLIANERAKTTGNRVARA